MYVTDELHVRPMQGRRKGILEQNEGAEGPGVVVAVSSQTAHVRSLSPQITLRNTSQHLSFELQTTGEPVSCSDCPKIWWCKAESQQAATQLRGESGSWGISVFCSSPATEGFPAASTL